MSPQPTRLQLGGIGDASRLPGGGNMVPATAAAVMVFAVPLQDNALFAPPIGSTAFFGRPMVGGRPGERFGFSSRQHHRRMILSDMPHCCHHTHCPTLK